VSDIFTFYKCLVWFSTRVRVDTLGCGERGSAAHESYPTHAEWHCISIIIDMITSTLRNIIKSHVSTTALDLPRPLFPITKLQWISRDRSQLLCDLERKNRLISIRWEALNEWLLIIARLRP
jgi:hypothetical protein